MSQKHLKELLKEEQEPFQLKDYIADKKKELVVPKSKLQLKKAKPISKSTSILCKNACFFSIQDSPDIRKSPKLFDFPPSPISHSAKSPNRVFLHVPAKTAAILLEAAVRIQKHRSKPKTQVKNSGLGLFGSMLKRLSLRNKTQKIKPKTEVDDENRGNDKIASVSSSSSSTTTTSSSNSTTTSFSCSCSLDLDSSSSGRSLDDDEFEFTNVLKENPDINYENNNGDYYSAICLSPFRFALHTTTPSPERRSPAKSPLRRKFEDNVRYDQKKSSVKFQEEEDEEDKEQNSPVSVLDPPFEDDYEGHVEDSDEVECSYAYVHRSQQGLLHRLHRFEKLAELDPIELEKRMIEEEEEEYLVEHVKEFERTLMQEVIRKTGLQDVKKPGIKRLISDLIIEEECEEQRSEEQVVKRVCNRLESWKEVESNTIDMMVEMDLRKEISDWKRSRKEFNETAMDIEVAIFAVLVDELLEDLA